MDVSGTVIPARAAECQVPTLSIGIEKLQETWSVMLQIVGCSLMKDGEC